MSAPQTTKVKKRKLTPPRTDGLKHIEAFMLDNDIANGVVGYVYFVSNHTAGTLKIGYTKDTARRLSELKTAGNDELYIYAAFLAPRSLEKIIHKRVKKYRVHREWYEHSEEIEHLIEWMEDYEIWNGLMTGDFSPVFGAQAFGMVFERWKKPV